MKQLAPKILEPLKNLVPSKKQRPVSRSGVVDSYSSEQTTQKIKIKGNL
jgi:hypothetical protein